MAVNIADLEQEFGIPSGLYARLLSKGEASGVDATSPKGAHGRAQLMPGTAADMGVDPNDPDQNLIGGAKYLGLMLKRYGRDQTRAVEAYNEGPGRVDKGVVYPETAAYVDRVTGANVVPNAGAASSTAPGGLDLTTLSALMSKLQGDTSKDPAYQAVVAAQGRSQAANAAEGAALDQESSDLKGVRDRLGQIKDPSAPTPPTLPGEGDYRDKALKAVSDKPMDPTRVMGQFLPMLAILGGAFTKGGAIGSLKAASAAMAAAKQNDTDAIARAHQQWMDDTGKLMDQYKLEQGAFQDAISSNGEKRADTLADMGVIAAQYNIPILKAQIAAGDLDGATKTIAARTAALEPMLKLYTDARQQEHMAAQDAHLGAQDTHLAAQDAALAANNPPAPDTSTPDARKAAIAKLSTDPGVALAAQKYLQTGTMPALGMGSGGKRGQIMELAGLIAQDQAGGAAGAPAAQAAFHADALALAQLEKTRTMVEQFEGTAQREADLALSLAKKGEAGGVPVINKWIQAGRQDVAGDPDVTSFNSALVSFKNEYVRIMSTGGTGGGGMTSDAARREGNELLNNAMSPAQLEQTIATMKKSMGNRKAALDDEYNETRKQLGSEAGGQPNNDAIEHPLSKADYDALPSGAHYTKPGDPEGHYRVKP